MSSLRFFWSYISYKKGLLALRRQVSNERATSAWELYERIDLGPGGYASAPARRAKQGAREAIRRKHRR